MKKLKIDRIPTKENQRYPTCKTLDDLALRTQVAGGRGKEDGEPAGSD